MSDGTPAERRTTVIVVTVLVAAIVGFAVWWALPRLPQFFPGPGLAVGSPEPRGDGMRMTVVDVHDGDTVSLAAVEAGGMFPVGESVSVRLIGIDAPEVPPQPPECFGEEAAAALRDLLNVGSVAYVERDVEPFDGYDRALLYVWNSAGQFVNLEMVAAGNAEAFPYGVNDRFADDFSAARAFAYDNELGAWGACYG